MEELYIRLIEGQPVDHPILGDNFRQAFPHLDTNNLPPNYARFERVAHPEIGAYEVMEVAYGWVDGVVKDIWTVRPMDDAERAERLQYFQTNHEVKLRQVYEHITFELSIAPDEYSRQAWRDYKLIIDAWIPEPIENPVFPTLPRKNARGYVVNLDVPGSTPNVIG